MSLVLSSSRGRQFLLQLFALGLFSRLVQILAILCLLNLNDYFTTAAQIPYLLPVAVLIFLLLILVGMAETRINIVILQLIQRLARIHKLLGLHVPQATGESGAQEQRDFIKNVFLPTIVQLPAAPIVAIFLVTSTPQLFVISIVQAAVNTGIVYRFNDLARSHTKLSSERSRPMGGGEELAKDPKAYILRRGTPERGDKGMVNEEANEDSGDVSNTDYPVLRRKRDALRLSNLLFRGLILVASAILAIYKIASLGSIVGYFILNNTLRYAFVILAEYLFPVNRHLSFAEACDQVNLALQPEQLLLDMVEQQQRRFEGFHQEFDQRMAERLNRKPYLRFNEFRVVSESGANRTLFDGLSARIELQSITLVHVSGGQLCKDLQELIDDRLNNSMQITCHGVAVCGQLSMDAQFWRQLPMYPYWHNRIIAPSLPVHFSPEFHERVSGIIEKYDLKRFYLEGESEPSQLRDFSKRQLSRMRGLLAWFDVLLEPHEFAVLPFALDLFDESEASQLLQILADNKDGQSRCLALLSRPLAADEQWRCYELKRGSLKRMT
ncbi:MAG: hypothetical protein VKP70_03570 [Cyanobacteriota bacterium]|nr:hypothetical protein [Cyanobacteriota bacterium]